MTRPKPTKLKLIDGIVNKKRINLNEPNPKPKAPSMPKNMDKVAEKEWKSLGPILEKLGVLTNVDGGAFEALCVSYGEWVKYSRQAQEKPLYKFEQTGYIQISPFVTLADKAFKNYIKLATEFGLTPSSRSRIVMAKDSADSTGADLLT